MPAARVLALALLVAMATPGCLEPTGPAPEPAYAVRGTFDANVTAEERGALRAEVEARGGELLVLESFPEQFVARGLDAEACEEVRAFAEAAPYVTSVGACDAEATGDEPAEPVAHPAEGPP